MAVSAAMTSGTPGGFCFQGFGSVLAVSFMGERSGSLAFIGFVLFPGQGSQARRSCVERYPFGLVSSPLHIGVDDDRVVCWSLGGHQTGQVRLNEPEVHNFVHVYTQGNSLRPRCGIRFHNIFQSHHCRLDIRSIIRMQLICREARTNRPLSNESGQGGYQKGTAPMVRVERPRVTSCWGKVGGAQCNPRRRSDAR